MKQPRAVRPVARALPHGGGRTVLGVVGLQAEPPTRSRPRPLLGAVGLEIEGPVPLPGEYPQGTQGFRYWAMAEALGRVAALWREAVPQPWSWAHGERLRVHLAPGAGPDAVYERGRLVVGGGATPGAAMRALGHAVLDALRPELWHVASSGVAKWHADFAEASALLATLEVPGEADALELVRQQATTVFGLALTDILGVLSGGAPARPATRQRGMDARLVALHTARLLAEAVRRAAVTPDLPAQVAAEFLLSAAVQERPLVVGHLRNMLARRGLLARSMVLEGYDPHAAEDGTELPLPARPLPWVAMDVALLGEDWPLLVCPASHMPLLAVSAEVPAPVAAARTFLASLAVDGLIERPGLGRHRRRGLKARAVATHRLVDEGRVVRLMRERFICR